MKNALLIFFSVVLTLTLTLIESREEGDGVMPEEELVELTGPNWASDCEHYEYRQEIPQPGMHILCLKSAANATINVSMIFS